LNTFSSAERQKIHDICDQNLSQELRWRPLNEGPNNSSWSHLRNSYRDSNS
jgi:hypothetical protein